MANKKNNEALTIVKQMVADGQISQEVAEKYFPELAESEDEKVRKWLVEEIYKSVNSSINKGFDIDMGGKALAWLEKQKHEEWSLYDEKILSEVFTSVETDAYSEEKKKEIISWLQKYRPYMHEKQGEKKSIEEVDGNNYGIDGLWHAENILKRTLGEVEGYQSDDGILEHKAAITAVKKLQEQKLVNKVEPKFKIGDNIIAKPETCMEHEPFHITNISDGFYWDGENSILVDNQNEFELYKVEPKFKVGDWVVYKDTVWKVCNISLLNYYELLKINNEVSTRFIKDVDETAHLWTIQDAKDGDVLTVNGKPFICYYIDGYKGNYCCIDDKGCFRTSVRFSFEGNCILPATKEQRNLLFQKIHEAGYEWNAEKKELKKIEQKTTEWSEEDRIHYNKCLQYLESISPRKEDMKWFKSLKDRVQPQPKQEWSEEDETKRKFIEGELSGIIADEIDVESPLTKRAKDLYSAFYWLKSLRPQNKWKPSDEQIKSLEEVINEGHFTSYPNAFETLCEQLKKLKE